MALQLDQGDFQGDGLMGEGGPLASGGERESKEGPMDEEGQGSSPDEITVSVHFFQWVSRETLLRPEVLTVSNTLTTHS
jgi:hypothetical protein